jgi:hypothetical protein
MSYGKKLTNKPELDRTGILSETRKIHLFPPDRSHSLRRRLRRTVGCKMLL